MYMLASSHFFRQSSKSLRNSTIRQFTRFWCTLASSSVSQRRAKNQSNVTIFSVAKMIRSNRSSLKACTPVFSLSSRVASWSFMLPCLRLSILLNSSSSSCRSLWPLSYCIAVNIIIIIIILIIMFFTLSDRNHTFLRRECTRLISVVPLCARTVILFCDDFNFYHYSLMDEKILYQSKLPGRVRSAISLSAHQILCTVVETRSLILLNIKQKSIDQICKLPQTKVFNEGRERDILTQTTLTFFEKTCCFYLYEPNIDQNKAKILFHYSPNKEGGVVSLESISTKEFSIKKQLVNKLDASSKLVMFNQEIENNGQFKFKTIDCLRKFEECDIMVEHPALTRFSIVKEIKAISKEEEKETYMLFLNSNEPTVLIVTEHYAEQSKYRINKILLSTILINVDLGFGMFMFMPDPQDPDPDYSSVIELVSLADGLIQDSKKCNVHQVVKSFQDDYLVYFKPENKATNLSVFRTDHIIGKKAHYMKLLQEGFRDLSGEMLSLIIQQLEG